MRQKLVVANWKMNPQTYKEAEGFVKSVLEYGRKDVVLCPPYPWLTDFSHKHQEVLWGAQDVFYEKEGAYTGEVSAKMLASSGVNYVIVG
ncbi:MAG: triose-phosphate isomerase, partial [Nanoarchaeota archaeon]|nr:triose-phosphate isomerase [Nanoarchaeota archaeon]